MRAAVLTDAGLRILDWPLPEPADGEALVALSKVGICGSDVHLAIDGSARTAFRPIVLGHEPSGRVTALGPRTEGPPMGTRVAIVPLISCLNCDRCRAGRTVLCRSSACIGVDRDGCLAEFAVVPCRNLIEVPPQLSDELAAVATDAVATAYHAVATRGGVERGSRVAVWGAGGLGLPAIAIVRHLGADTVIAVEPRPQARAWALEAGADEAVHPDEAFARIRALGGVDVALEFVGRRESVEGAVRSLDRGGRAVVVGVGHGSASAGRLISFVPQERELVGSWGSEPGEIRHVLGLLASGELRLPRIVGDVIGLDEVPAGLDRLARGQIAGSRIVVDLAG